MNFGAKTQKGSWVLQKHRGTQRRTWAQRWGRQHRGGRVGTSRALRCAGSSRGVSVSVWATSPKHGPTPSTGHGDMDGATSTTATPAQPGRGAWPQAQLGSPLLLPTIWGIERNEEAPKSLISSSLLAAARVEFNDVSQPVTAWLCRSES